MALVDEAQGWHWMADDKAILVNPAMSDLDIAAAILQALRAGWARGEI